MKLLSLEVINFRNIDYLFWEPGYQNSIITGNNGQGKTNLLESIYFLLSLRPMRTGSDIKPLLKHGCEFFSIKGKLNINNTEITLFVSWSKGKKNLKVNGNNVTASQYLENNTILFFSPDESSLLVESPEKRRRLIDKFIFFLDPDYYEILVKFKSILKRRNRILKEEIDINLLKAIDKSFIPLAFEVSKRRIDYLNKVSSIFTDQWNLIKPDFKNLKIIYKSNNDISLGIEQYKNNFENRYDSDFRNRTTFLGPQREDFLFFINQISSKYYLSHGERKSASLAFNLAFANYFIKNRKIKPLILIDDLASELDDNTFDKSMNLLFQLNSQIISCGLRIPPIFKEKDCLTWKVDNGRLEKL